MNKPIFLIGCVLATSIILGGQAQAGTTIWGLSNINKVHKNASAPYIVFMGSFANYKYAIKMESDLKARGYRAKLKRKGNLYIVYIGPFTNLQELHALASNHSHSPNVWHVKQNTSTNTTQHQKIQSKPIAQSNQQSDKGQVQKDMYCKDCQLEHNNWFVQVQGGAVFPLSQGPILVDNGSNFPAPEHVDRYSVNQSTQGTIALTVGKRIATQSSFINHYTLSGRLQYVFESDVGDTTMQYSLPQYLNYNYNWKLSTLALTADTKLNGFNFYKFSPYINGGLGVSFNQARSFNETALQGITPRISPAFSNHTSTQFTYHVGAGLDFSVTPSWLLSAGYEFEGFGDFSSGHGKTTWSGESLSLGPYQTNTLLFGVTYLIN